MGECKGRRAARCGARRAALSAALAVAASGACGDGHDRVPTDVSEGSGQPATGDYDVSQVLVRLAPGSTPADLERPYGTTELGRVVEERIYLLKCPPGWTVDEMLPFMATDPAVQEAEPNFRTENPEAEARTGSTMTFADTRQGEAAYADQHALARIRAQQAWTFSRGAGVLVALLDTGVDAAHPALAGRLAPGGDDFVEGDGDPSDRPDHWDSDADGLVDEAVGHGTAVAGLVLSVAPEASVLPLRILDSDGIGNAFDVALGLIAAERAGAAVVNMSFGMRRTSRIVATLLERIHRRGRILVASAGNRHSTDAQYPAALEGVLGVAATDSLDRKADFSNFGDWVAVSAPGVGLVSLAPRGRYAAWSGTSFAAALVSGEAALLLAAGPSSADGTRRTIVGSAVPLAMLDPAFGDRLGSGRIDVLAAVRHGDSGSIPLTARRAR